MDPFELALTSSDQVPITCRESPSLAAPALVTGPQTG